MRDNRPRFYGVNTYLGRSQFLGAQNNPEFATVSGDALTFTQRQLQVLRVDSNEVFEAERPADGILRAEPGAVVDDAVIP